jgi:hypothetical protein
MSATTGRCEQILKK